MGSPLSGDNTIDQVLKYCQIHRIHTVSNDDLPKDCRSGNGNTTVRIGNIAFRCYSHDTGNDVRGWIINGDEAYEFVSTTYWFSSHYTFNSSRWERGAWDTSVNEFFATLRQAKEQHEARSLALQEEAQKKRQQEAAERKALFERQFVQHNS